MATNPNIILPAEVLNGGILRKAPVNVRFDQQIIAPNIQIGELRWVQPLLGDALYADFIADQVAETTPPTEPKFNNTDYQTLWDKYLHSFIARAVIWASIGDIGLQVGVNGIYLNNTETSENAGIKGIQAKQDSLGQGLIVLSDAIRAYLCTNAALFPLYDATKKCKCDGLPIQNGGQRMHVIFPKKKRCKRC